MNPPEEKLPGQKYIWPWFVLGFAILGIALAVFWVALAAKKIEQQRDYSSPLPVTEPAR